MSAYQGRRDVGRTTLKRLRLLGMAGLVVVAAFGVWNVYGKQQESMALRAQAESERNDLAARESQLRGDLEKLKTDRGMEEALREQYALAGKGEGLIMIVDQRASSTESASAAPSENWFQGLFSWF